MRYYTRENARRYEKMARMGLEEWAESVYGGMDLEDFSSRAFLEWALPRLVFEATAPTALELGTGVGPGALFLAERGFRVTGYDVIPEAIETARKIAAARERPIRYETVDITRMPHDGERFDLVVDSFCLNHIVFAAERRAVFEGVKARLKPGGYYLVSSSMYDARRHTPDENVVDGETGKTYEMYDGDCIYDPGTDYYYEPFDKYPSERERAEACADLLTVNGTVFIPKRCYRNGERLRAELRSHGFVVLSQEGDELPGEYDENVVCAHAGSGVRLQ